MNQNMCIFIGAELKKSIDNLTLIKRKELYKEVRNFIQSWMNNEDFVNLDEKELRDIEERLKKLQMKIKQEMKI